MIAEISALQQMRDGQQGSNGKNVWPKNGAGKIKGKAVNWPMVIKREDKLKDYGTKHGSIGLKQYNSASDMIGRAMCEDIEQMRAGDYKN